MIKKNSRIMAFLIAIQSLAFFSAIEVNAAVLKGSASQNGEINNAAAYKDGSFYIEGNIEGRGSAACYLKDDVYSKLKNITANIDISDYGTKYIQVHNGDYYLDMSNGNLSSEGLRKKDLNDAGVKLKDSISNDNIDRYKKEELNNPKTLTELPKNKFSEGWYETKFTVNDTSKSINNGAEDVTVYSDGNGNYIDADYNLGNIKVELTNGKTAEIKNTHDKVENARAAIAATEVIAEDSKNIYRLAEISLKCDEVGVGFKSVNGIELNKNASAFLVGDNGGTVIINVIQSLSKESAVERAGGIKYSKKVTNYVLGNNSGQNISLLKNASDGFTMSNGKLINYSYNQVTLQAEVIELKNNGIYSYIEEKSKSSIKINKGESSIDIDANGDLWALNDKNLYKFNTNSGFEKAYELDNKYTDLSVYDKNNIVVWNKENKIYSIIGSRGAVSHNNSADNTIDNITNETKAEGSNEAQQDKQHETKAESSNEAQQDKQHETKVESSNEAQQDKQHEIKVSKSESQPKNKGWVKGDNGQWSYVDENGSNHTGWLNDAGIWYYLGEDGVMKTKWQNIDGSWYYFNSQGKMLSNTIVEGYVVGFDGKIVE